MEEFSSLGPAVDCYNVGGVTIGNFQRFLNIVIYAGLHTTIPVYRCCFNLCPYIWALTFG